MAAQQSRSAPPAREPDEVSEEKPVRAKWVTPALSGQYKLGEATSSAGKVLLVDDNLPLLRGIARSLAAQGFEVACCPDGARALNLVRHESFDVVVSDIAMPYLDGIELLRAIHARDPDLPVIIATGEATVSTAVDAVEHGAFKYLLKPVDIEQLAASTRTAVQLRRLAQAKREALAMLGGSSGLAASTLGLEDSFERALSSLWPAFQPIVHAADGELFGFEALLRTEEPSMPHPECVLDAAQRLGQLRRLGRAVRDIVTAEFLAYGGDWTVFVNLHPEDLNDPELLDPCSLPAQYADRMVLEITERVALDVVPNLREKIAAARQLGFRIAIDDLGAGYAGLASFVALEPDFVKLDMSLTRAVDQCPTRQKLVRSMTALSREMGITVVAEGIETEQERMALIDLGCELLQGYHFGRPSKLPRKPVTTPPIADVDG